MKDQAATPITGEVLERAAQGDLSALSQIPKGDLHAHALLSAPFHCYEQIAGKKLPTPPTHYSGFSHFSTYLREVMFPLYSSVEIRREILGAALEQMISDGVIYTQLSFDLMSAVSCGTSWRTLGAEFKDVLRTFSSRITVEPELGIGRELLFPEWRASLEDALASGFFAGIDIYGDETKGLPIHCLEAARRARGAGLRIKLHSGELLGVDTLIDEIKSIKPDSVQHGIAARGSADAIAQLAALSGSVNICPASNLALGAIASYQELEIDKFLAAGVSVTIGSDDYALFGRSLSEEYLALYLKAGLSVSDLETFRQHSLAAL